MAILLIFLLGVVNFALHKAVLESGHPVLAQVQWFYHGFNGKLSLMVEFAVLLGSMLLVASGSTGWGWFYLGYSAVNALSAWAILTHRV